MHSFFAQHDRCNDTQIKQVDLVVIVFAVLVYSFRAKYDTAHMHSKLECSRITEIFSKVDIMPRPKKGECPRTKTTAIKMAKARRARNRRVLWYDCLIAPEGPGFLKVVPPEEEPGLSFPKPRSMKALISEAKKPVFQRLRSKLFFSCCQYTALYL
jgi:hypothetical protein